MVRRESRRNGAVAIDEGAGIDMREREIVCVCVRRERKGIAFRPKEQD